MVHDLGDALDHAHSQGVVHRDVKPGNVLIREDGVTKLADLGIATASDGTKITRSGTVLGTVAYMAPEQLDGRGAGPPADVYALAAISFEALSGKRPREGGTPFEIAHRIATEGAPDLLDVWPTAPEGGRARAEARHGFRARGPPCRPPATSRRELTRALEDAPEETTQQDAPPFGRGSKAAAAGAAGAAAAGAARAQGAAAHPPAAAPSRPDPEPPTPSRHHADRRGTLQPPAVAVRPRASPPRIARRRPRGATVTAVRPRAGAIALAAIFIALAASPRSRAPFSRVETTTTRRRRAPTTRPRSRRPTRTRRRSPRPRRSRRPEEPNEPAASAPPPAEEQSDSGSSDEARGAELNDQGFNLMSAGDYDGAIPVLQEAVNSFPPGTDNLNYAYALFNLGKSLRLAGRPDEAIPILEQRLKIPNQTEAVQAELDQAKREAGKELGSEPAGAGRGQLLRVGRSRDLSAAR